MPASTAKVKTDASEVKTNTRKVETETGKHPQDWNRCPKKRPRPLEEIKNPTNKNCYFKMLLLSRFQFQKNLHNDIFFK